MCHQLKKMIHIFIYYAFNLPMTFITISIYESYVVKFVESLEFFFFSIKFNIAILMNLIAQI